MKQIQLLALLAIFAQASSTECTIYTITYFKPTKQNMDVYLDNIDAGIYNQHIGYTANTLFVEQQYQISDNSTSSRHYTIVTDDTPILITEDVKVKNCTIEKISTQCNQEITSSTKISGNESVTIYTINPDSEEQ